ncbi:MAG: PrsW family glutamic-type intramembrane protease [Candidatus Hodarchaeota archaeon]
MSMKNPYKPENVKLELQKKVIWLISMFGCGIYAIIVFIMVFLTQIPEDVKLITIYSYMIIGPIAIYLLWLLLYIWKTQKWPPSEKLVGGRKLYLLLIFLIGICVINFAAYWNSGIDNFWLIFAVGIYFFTKDELLTVVIYYIGASAITPALVEEFLKSFPSILAFFVVLQRNRKSKEKGRGLLGNELNGFLFGMIIGISFEILELIYYLQLSFLYGGRGLELYFLLYTQVTIRNWAPIHILGGSIGGFAAGRAERLRFERGEENLPMKNQILKFLKRFIPLWLIPVSIHFLWNSSYVWVLLYLYIINVEDIMLAEIILITIYVLLASLSYALLIIFLRQANKNAKNTYRCPETGLIVANEDIVCTTFSDKYYPESFKVSQRSPANFCTRCGKPLKINAHFCIYCGYKLKQYNSYPSSSDLYDKYTMTLFIISIIVSIFFIHYSLLLFISYLGSNLLIFILLQMFILILSAGLTIYASIRLILLKKNYNGRKSIWCWLILLFNLIGMFGTLLIYGISGFLFYPIFYGAEFGIIEIGLIILVLIGAAIILPFLLLVLVKGQQTLHYQRIT